MGSSRGVLPIPWEFTTTEFYQIWEWNTQHFRARVSVEGNTFVWEIGDWITSVDEEPRFLAEGRAGSFSAAEVEVREVIGKSYPVKLGYRDYAGTFATTFVVATGERVDLGAFDGQRSVVQVRMPTGVTQTFVGTTQVVHYELFLTPETGSAVKILPAHIVSIRGEGGDTGSARAAYTGVGRIYRGVKGPRCTGKPGFLPETIDHTGDPCPVHEKVNLLM